MKRVIYISTDQRKILIPIQFPFETKKLLMDRIKSLWNCRNFNKIFEILNNSERNYEVLFTITLNNIIPKRLGSKEIKRLLMYKRVKRFSIEELRLHKLNRYSSYTINCYHLYHLIFTEEDFIGAAKVFDGNDNELFINSLFYIIYKQEIQLRDPK